MSDRAALVRLVGVGAVALIIGFALLPGRDDGAPRGNAVVVINTGATGVDSVVIEADPPGTHHLAARAGYVAPMDSARLALPAGAGDADIRVWRNGHVVADHLAYFGGRTWFEVRVGDAAQLGRYRRLR
ncbi:MAG: hypothetical protein ABIP29_03385 [Candidatus Eisenbacteria bacterium]